MPSTAWRDVRRDILRVFGLIESVTSSALLADATTVVSNQLAAEYPQDGAFEGSFLTLVRQADGGDLVDDNASNPTRRITDYTASTGTLTIAGEGYAAETEMLEFDIFGYNPRFVARAYNRAARAVFSDGVGVIRDDETTITGINQHIYSVPPNIRKIYTVYMGQQINVPSVTGQLLDNPDFENWDSLGSPEDWDTTGSPTITRIEDNVANNANDYFVLTGSSSVRIAPVSDAAWTLYQDVDVLVRYGQFAVSGWAYSTDTDISLQVTETTGTVLASVAHEGNGWQYMSIEMVLDTASDTVRVAFASSSTSHNYIVDSVVAVHGPQGIPDEGYIPISGHRHILATDGDPGYGHLHFEAPPEAKRRLRMVGLDMLGQVRSDTDEVELDGNWLEPIILKSQMYLAEEMITTSMGDAALEAQYRNMANDFRAQYADVLVQGAVQQIPIPDLRQYTNVGLSDIERRVIG